MGALINGTGQARMTDVIREELMTYIYSDDNLEDAYHLITIFKELEGIDIRFRDLDDEVRDLRKRNASLTIERNHLENKLMAATSNEDPE